ncbi:MAG: sel1 repeat family protein [Myxococcales bacterium]|nr:sel1 repeat family protein [Myxococcales bacterium]
MAPDPIRYDQAVGGAQKCFETKATRDTLVVDMDPNDRLQLEAAMSEGVAVVHYDCDGIRLLSDCRVQGGYGFKGTTLKEQVIQLETADEVAANLPSVGRVLAVDLQAELSRGASLDVAVAMVGRSKASRVSLGTSDLKGECEGATHFVRGATLGAFAMSQGTRGKARVAAEIFGAGASAGTMSKRLAKQRDGDARACQASTSKALSPPNQCGALIRLELKPIVNGNAPQEPDLEVRDCPEGFAFQGGKCAVAAPGSARFCDPDDESDCEAQCVAGNADSCAVLGYHYLERDQLATAAPLFKRGCEGGNLLACHNYGFAYYMGQGVPQDYARARDLFTRVCEGGEAVGCSGLALLYAEGHGVPQSNATAFELYNMACNAGEFLYGCPFLGRFYQQGLVVPQDIEKARALYQRSCDQQSPNGCSLLKQLAGQ